jgi:hypothetical protein
MTARSDTLIGYDEDIVAWATEQARLIRAGLARRQRRG